jgi:succinoglycan biosynthesis transport protein ExoP
MAQYDINLREYWRVVKKRKPIVILTVILLTAFSVTLAKLRAPMPLYESTCSVKFEKAVSPVGIYTQILSWGPGDVIQTQMAVIKGYPVFTRVAKALGRIDKAEKPTPAIGRIISGLQSQVRVRREAESNIVNITATATKPGFAAQLANQVALAYKETRAEEINQRIAEAIKFIEGQLTIVGERLKRSEERLQEFRRKRDVIAINSQSSNLLSRAYSLETRLSDTLEAKIELEAVMERIKGAGRRPLSSKRSFSSDKASPLYQKLNAKLVDLMLERDALLIQYTSSHPKVVELSKQVSEIARKMIIELESQLNTLTQREQGLRKEIQSVSAQVEALPVKGLELGRLERDVERTSQLYSLLETKHQEALIQNAEKPDEVIIVRPAFEPTSPINRPNMTSSGLLGALIGLVLGLVFAFIIETLDTSLGAIGDVEQTLGLPVVGLIPYVESKEGKAPVIPHFGHQSVLAESFTSLKTILQFSALEKDIKSIVLTSATPLEGKSVVAANLAIAMAQGGLRTILLSMDLRKPTLHKIFGLDTSPGITDFLLGNGDASRVIKTVADLMMGEMGVENIMLTPGIDNLHIITCGKIPSNPVQLIQSEKFRDLLDALYGSYDVILMDTPPLISAADASILAMKSDGVLLVYRAGEVGRGILKRIKDQLEQVKATIIGVVLNGVKAEISPDFDELKHHKYYYYYGGEGKKKKAKKEKGGRKSLRLFFLSIVLCLVIGGLLWQTGMLDLKKYGFKKKLATERSSVALASIKILKPKKSPSVPSADAREPVSPPSPSSHNSFKIQGTKPDKKTATPENDAKPAPKRTISEFSLAKVSNPLNTDKPERKSSPKPPSPPVHYPYSVMTGSFKTWKGADEAMASLREKGLSPYWTLVNLGKRGTWYRVCVGHFETSQDANAFAQRFGLKESRVIETAYSNRIGDFASKQEIEQKLASLKKAGYSPYIIEDPQKGYRLLVGAHLKREAADEMAGKLKDAGIDSKVVLR